MRAWLVLACLYGCSFTPGRTGVAGDPVDADGDAASSSDAMGDGSGSAQPVTLSFGERSGSTNKGVTVDTYVESAAATTPQGSNVGVWADAGPVTNGLLRFDLSAVPTGGTVTTAELMLMTNGDSLESGMLQVYAALEAWDETTATWNERMTGTAWANLGASSPGSRGSTLLGEVFPGVDETAYTLALDLATVQGWIAQPATNHGMVLISTSPSMNGVTFHSSEDAMADTRPQLRLVYTP